jgi:Sulfotransferase family
MLDSHPEMAIPHETHFLVDLVGAKSEVRTAEAFGALVTRYFTWRDFELDDIAFRRTIARIQPFTVPDAIRSFFAQYAARFGKSRWGDKTPGYFAIMREIEDQLPEVRFVHLIRDGRDVAVSKRHLWFGAGPDIEDQARNWVGYIREAQETGARSGHYCEIRYEELVASPEPVLRSLCTFLELPYSSEMLAYHRRAHERLAELKGWPDRGASASEFEVMHALTRKPPQTSRIGRWRTEMSREEVRSFEAIAGETLQSAGYALSDSGHETGGDHTDPRN